MRTAASVRRRPNTVRALLAELPERARTDCAIWGWDDRGDVPIEEYEAAGVTWWMVETYGLDAERLRALAESGPGRLVRSSSTADGEALRA